ncbi:MAG: hypothetical protein K2X47_01760, partial [Bdellovibrionales bacterium]|nr:hypothetical protein [Bdellovibrionales bacterium]
ENTALKTQFQIIRQEAQRLAGGPDDIPQRVIFLHEIFLDSGKIHTFPEVALHGALWADQFFSHKNTVDRILLMKKRVPLIYRAPVVKKVNEFAEALLKTNRQVFIDTYTNYYFSKKFGMDPDANQFVPAQLLDLLNQAHLMNSQQVDFPGTEPDRSFRAKLFESSLRNEQEKSVAPMVQVAVGQFCIPQDPVCPWIRALILKPVVRFNYFPSEQLPFFFFNFSNSEERIMYALKSYNLAEDVGWPIVADKINSYRATFPPQFVSDPIKYAETLKAQLLR